MFASWTTQTILLMEPDGSAGKFESKFGSNAFSFEKLNQLQSATGGWAFAARNATDAADAAEQQADKAADDEPDDFIHASCFIFKRSGLLRRNAVALSQTNIFEGIVLLLIVANSITLVKTPAYHFELRAFRAFVLKSAGVFRPCTTRSTRTPTRTRC